MIAPLYPPLPAYEVFLDFRLCGNAITLAFVT